MNLLRFVIGNLLLIRLLLYHNLGLGSGPNFRWQYNLTVYNYPEEWVVSDVCVCKLLMGNTIDVGSQVG